MSGANSDDKTTSVLFPGQKTGLSPFRDCVLSPGRAGIVDGEEVNAPSGILVPVNSNQYPQRVRHQLPESPVDVSQGL